MLKLYRIPRYEGLLGGASPYVYKLETWLRMAEIPYEDNELPFIRGVERSPLNMVPYVVLDDEPMADANIIIDRLKDLHGDPLNDKRLTREQQVLGHTLRSFCEEDVAYMIAYGRWIDGDYKTFGSFVFAEVREDQRKVAVEGFLGRIKERLNAMHIGRHEPEFVRKKLRIDLGILSDALGDGPFLFGNAPSTYDAALFGVLASFIHFPLPNPHVAISREFSNLVEYCDRIRQTYYGDVYDALGT